jgi:hypothetical protein
VLAVTDLPSAAAKTMITKLSNLILTFAAVSQAAQFKSPQIFGRRISVETKRRAAFFRPL